VISVKRANSDPPSPIITLLLPGAYVATHNNASYIRQPNLNTPQRHYHRSRITTATMSSAETPEDYTTWTPEQLVRDYHGELKGDLFIRVAEWYTNPEVEAKINSGRSDGSKIKQPNFYAEFKRNVDNAAIGEGHLPAEYRLQFDKRRLANLEARFGPEHGSVRQIRTSVRQREAVGCKSFQSFSVGTVY
jgi:hypothetical protein